MRDWLILILYLLEAILLAGVVAFVMLYLLPH